MDTFLKPIAEKTWSYIRDTIDFIMKTKDVSVQNGSIMVTVDVIYLYPNIGQEEVADLCEKALDNRETKTVLSDVLKRLILCILKSNIMAVRHTIFYENQGNSNGNSHGSQFCQYLHESFRNWHAEQLWEPIWH